MNRDTVKYALGNIKNRRIRSGLTILSILIGIASIFALVSFGVGLTDYVNGLSDKMGRDKLIIQAKGSGAPGTDSTFTLTQSDIDYLGTVSGIEIVAGMRIGVVEVQQKREKKYVFAMGVPMETKALEMFNEIGTIEIDKGRELKKGDKLKAVLGANYQEPNKIFKKPLKIGDEILINGKKVTIIGFYKSVGNPSDDAQVYLTDEGMLEIFPEKVGKYDAAFARVDKGENATAVARLAEKKLAKYKGQKEGSETFYIQTFEQIVESFSMVLDIIQGMLILIALVSVLVAGVNIANTMYTAVIERTKEIGIMKAVGATNLEIMLRFLFEAGTLGLIGGALGVILGFLIASAGGAIALAAGYGMLKPAFPWQLIAGCLAFSFVVGALAGLLPARQASKLKPVDALRYE